MIGKKVKIKDQIGTVSDIYKTFRDSIVVIVDLENGEKVKAFAQDVEIVQDQEEKKTKSVDEITITREEFRDKAIDLAVKECTKTKTPLIGVVFSILLSKLEGILFGEPEND